MLISYCQNPDYGASPAVGTVHFITDHVGSVRQMVSTDSGSLNSSIDFDEFGVPTSVMPPQLSFGFDGGLRDRNTGLVHFGNRDYDPVVGRFLSRDSILFEGSDTNLYGYVLNDPVNLIDPSGLSWTSLRNLVVNGGMSAFAYGATAGIVYLTAQAVVVLAALPGPGWVGAIGVGIGVAAFATKAFSEGQDLRHQAVSDYDETKRDIIEGVQSFFDSVHVLKQTLVFPLGKVTAIYVCEAN